MGMSSIQTTKGENRFCMGSGHLVLLMNKKWQIHHKKHQKMWFVERSLFAILQTILQAKIIVRSTQLAG